MLDLVFEGAATGAAVFAPDAGADLLHASALDASQGQHTAPPAPTLIGSGGSGGPGPGDRNRPPRADSSNDRDPGDRGDSRDRGNTGRQRDSKREPSDSERRRDMERSAAETALLDAASNAGKVGTATGIINTVVGGSVALGQGVTELHRNQGRGLGGSSRGGRAAMDAALREMPQSRPAKGKR